MKANEPYYPTGMYGQQETKGRTVLEELVVKYTAAMLSNSSLIRVSMNVDSAKVIVAAREMAKETIKQLSDEVGLV